MPIPVKLTISTKHVLPANEKNLSLFDQFRHEAMDAVDQVMEEMSETLEPGSEAVFTEEEYFDPEEVGCEDAIRQKLEALIEECFSAVENSENTGRYVFTTEAEMEVTPGEIVLSYEEAPGSELGETGSIIRIDRRQDHCLSIQRTGNLMNTLICEKGRRHTSVYSSPMIPMPLEVCTYTKRCDIDLDEEGGVIFLDYIIEIRGADVQRTTIRMNIIPMDN